jgi:VWA domain-containing protein
MTGPRSLGIRGVDLRASSRLLTRPPLAAAQMQSQALPTRLPDLTGAPPAVQQQLTGSLVVMFAIDGSGSVHGPHGTDPHGARNAACLSVVDLMHRHGGGRAGVVHWGQTAPADLALPPMPVRRGRLRRMLALQPMLGGTNPAAALARVRQLVPVVSQGQTLVVLLLTDGQDLGSGLAGQLAQLPPASVHPLLVDPSGNCYGRETVWQALPWGSFTRLADLHDPQRVAWESGAVIARCIGLDLPGQAHS